MPIMLRPPGKLKKIAYTVLSVPANMREHRVQRRKKIDKYLRVEETKNVK